MSRVCRGRNRRGDPCDYTASCCFVLNLDEGYMAKEMLLLACLHEDSLWPGYMKSGKEGNDRADYRNINQGQFIGGYTDNG